MSFPDLGVQSATLGCALRVIQFLAAEPDIGLPDSPKLLDRNPPGLSATFIIIFDPPTAPARLDVHHVLS